MGNWDKAILKSIGWGIILLICYHIWEVGFQEFPFSGFVTSVLLFLGAYLVLSFAGWLIFGLPLHLVLCKYSKTSYINYILPSLVFCLLLILFSHLEAAIVLGLPALFQAVMFRFYVFKT